MQIHSQSPIAYVEGPGDTLKQVDRHEHFALPAPCPVCGVKAGQPCRSSGGWMSKLDVHVERVAEAL